MIDFKNGVLFKLKPVDISAGDELCSMMFVEGENIFATFQTVRDIVVFTNKRVITVNVQGISGSKKDYTSLPYSKVQAFSVETAGSIDLDSEIELWFSGLGKVKFLFKKASFDIRKFNQILSSYIL